MADIFDKIADKYKPDIFDVVADKVGGNVAVMDYGIPPMPDFAQNDPQTVPLPYAPQGKGLSPYEKELAARKQADPYEQLRVELNNPVNKAKAEMIAKKGRGFWGELFNSLKQGSLNVTSGIAGTVQKGAELLDKPGLNYIGQKAGQLASMARAGQDLPELAQGQKGGVGEFTAQAVGQAFPYMAASVASTILTGTPAAAFGTAFAIEGENAYQDAIKAGASEEDANMERLVVGTLNGAIEQLQVDEILKFGKAKPVKELIKAAKEKAIKKITKAGGKAGVALVKSSIKEGLEEALQETVSALAPAINDRKLQSGKDIAKRVGMAGLGGAVAGGIFSGGGAIINTIQNTPVGEDGYRTLKVENEDQAKQAQEEIAKFAEQNKVDAEIKQEGDTIKVKELEKAPAPAPAPAPAMPVQTAKPQPTQPVEVKTQGDETLTPTPESATIPAMTEDTAARSPVNGQDIAPENTASGKGEIKPENTKIVSGTFYHNTDNAGSIIESGGFLVESTRDLSKQERGLVSGNLGDGIYLSPDYNTNKNTWGGNENIRVHFKKPLKMYDLGSEEGSASIDIEFADKIKDAGYDGIIVNDPNPKSGGNQIVIFDPKNIEIEGVVEQMENDPENLYDIDMSISSFNPPVSEAGDGGKITLTSDNLPDKSVWKTINEEIAIEEYSQTRKKYKPDADFKAEFQKMTQTEKKRRIKDYRPSGKLDAGMWLKHFAKVEPEFAANPVFVVQDSMLVFKDGYRYRLEPKWFGLNKNDLKEGQKIQVDLASLKLKQKTKPAIATKSKSPTPTGNASGGTSIGDPDLGASGIDRGRIEVSLEPGGKPMPAREIVDYVGRAFNIPMRGKATHVRKKALGWFDPKGIGIRMKDVRELTTAMHEIGHHIDWTLNKRWSLNPPLKAITDELLSLGKALYGSRTPPGGYKSEGWAEYIRAYLTGEDTAKLAPALDKWFKETYLPSNKDITKKLNITKGMIDKWRLQGAEKRIDSQISTGKIKGSIPERIERGMLWVDTNFRDELAPIRVGMKKAGIGTEDLPYAENPYQIAVARADKAGAVARQFVLKYTTDTSGEWNGMGLSEALEPVSNNMAAFTRWMVAARAKLLHSRGINPGISKMDADYVYDKYDSQIFQDVLKEVTAWNHRVLNYLVEAGGMSQEALNRIEQLNPIYVPFMRAFKEGELNKKGGVGRGVAKVNKAVKSIKGSGREIIDPLESMITQTEKIIATAHKAEVAKALAKLADKPGMDFLIWKVPAPTEATKFEAEQIKRDIAKIAYKRMGLDPEEISSSMLERWNEEITVFTNASAYYGKDNIVSLVIDGKPQFFEVDPALYRAIEGLDQYSLPWALDLLLGKPARMVRLGATGLNASFGLIRNFLRDALTFTVQSKHAKLGPVSAVYGIAQDIIDTPTAQKFKAMGGKMSVQVLADRRAAQTLKKEVLKHTMGKHIVYTVGHPVDALRELFGVTEAGTRIGEFDAALKYGEKKWGKDSKSAALYALNQAQDVTTNFSRHGRMAKILNQIIPFFNAAIQGPDKMVRTFKNRPVSTTLKAIIALTLPAIWLWWKNRDKEWYKNMPEYERVNYLHFEVHGTDKIIRIPVPFELGHIFMSAPVAALDAQYKEDPKIFDDMFKESLQQNNPFAWPAAISPIIDNLQNEDFSGKPIVSRSAEYKLPEDQYNKYTSKLMKTLGKQLNMSPAKLEHLVNSYSGGLYQRINRTVNLKDEENIDIENAPVVGTLFLKDPDAPKKQLNDFYERRDILNRKYASKKITDREKAIRKVYEKTSREISDLTKKLDSVKNKSQKKVVYNIIKKKLEITKKIDKDK